MLAIVESISEGGVRAIELITGRFSVGYYHTTWLNLAEETVPLEQDASTATDITAATDITDTLRPSVSLMQVTSTANDITDTLRPSVSLMQVTSAANDITDTLRPSSADTPFTLEDLQDPAIFGQVEEEFKRWLLRLISSGRNQITKIARFGGGPLRRLLFFAGHKKFSDFIQFYPGGGFWFSKRGYTIIRTILGLKHNSLHTHFKQRGFLHHPNNLKEKEGVYISQKMLTNSSSSIQIFTKTPMLPNLLLIKTSRLWL